MLNDNESTVELGQVLNAGVVGWYVKKHSKATVLVSLDYPLFVSNYLIIVNFVLEENRSKVVIPICRDALVGDDFRKLKILLREKVSSLDKRH